MSFSHGGLPCTLLVISSLMIEMVATVIAIFFISFAVEGLGLLQMRMEKRFLSSTSPKCCKKKTENVLAELDEAPLASAKQYSLYL